jgi:uncharacterized protein YgiM (DUF1202 family)
VRRAALLLLVALALPAYAALQTGTVTRAAELRSTPFSDGKTLKTLAPGTSVEVVKRVGGWYQVKAGGADGWVRMWLLRFASSAGSGSSSTVAVLQSGRSGSTYTTATTGVRGLSEEELANAQPDAAAVQAVDRMATTPADARAFAQQASLKASPNLMRGAQ